MLRMHFLKRKRSERARSEEEWHKMSIYRGLVEHRTENWRSNNLDNLPMILLFTSFVNDLDGTKEIFKIIIKDERISLIEIQLQKQGDPDPITKQRIKMKATNKGSTFRNHS